MIVVLYFEVIRTISIFLRKGFEHTKTPHNQKPTTKTETNKSKTTKKQFFTQKTSKRGGDSLFYILVFFYAQNIFIKKNKQV